MIFVITQRTQTANIIIIMQWMKINTVIIDHVVTFGIIKFHIMITIFE